MKMTSLRRVLTAVAVLAGTAALVTSPALAQAPPGPPVCGGVASLMNMSLGQFLGGNIGINLVSIPAISPVNNNPSGASNGFKQLCDRFGLATAGTSVVQFKAFSGGGGGVPVTYTCDQPSPPTWTVGQAAMIKPAAAATGKIPGVECARPYTYYADSAGPLGDNLHPVPLTIALIPNSPQAYCSMMGLRDTAGAIPGDTILDFVPATGPQTHVCGQAPLFTLTIGRALMVRPATQGICTSLVCTRGKVGNACVGNSDCDLAGGAAAVTGTPVIF